MSKNYNYSSTSCVLLTYVAAPTHTLMYHVIHDDHLEIKLVVLDCIELAKIRKFQLPVAS